MLKRHQNASELVLSSYCVPLDVLILVFTFHLQKVILKWTLSGREQQYLAAAPALPGFAVGTHGDRGALTPSALYCHLVVSPAQSYSSPHVKPTHFRPNLPMC